MDAIIDFLIGYGYWGMLLASFLAGSVFPFSSELVMTAPDTIIRTKTFFI